MAARGVQAPRRPVTLRDFLELACDSSSDGFRNYPRRLPLIPDADVAVLQHLHHHQQQTPPAPRPEAAAAQLLRRSPSRSPSSLSFFSSLSGSAPGPGALARISSLSRSFSRRIKEGFWRRRDEGDDDDEAAYFDDRDSCGFPSPLVSSCSTSDSDEFEYTAEFEADVTTMTEETPTSSERDKATASTSSSSSSSSSVDHDRTDAAAAVDGKKVQAAEADGDDSAVGRKMGARMVVEDKQQLSPVSVLDFRFDDDDGEEEGSDAGTCCSPASQFQRCTPPAADLHRTKQQEQLLHKIRRYDDSSVAQGIDPVDLDARFTAATSGSESGESADASTRLATTTSGSSTNSSSSAETTAPQHDDDEAEHQSAKRSPSPHHRAEQEEPDDEYRLLARLLEHDTAAAACLDDEVSRVLILDFFAEGADRLIRSAVGSRPLDDDRSEAAAEALVGTAAEWLRGAGPRWGIGDVVHSGKAALDDMERSRRWMCVGEEEHDVGADVQGAVVDALLDELVTELPLLPWWPRGDMVLDASDLGCVRSLTEC